MTRAAAGSPLPTIEGPEPGDWRGPRNAGQLERIIGTESTLVPISHLEIGLLCARAVAKVQRSDGSSGTGFLTPGGVLVTNNHVLPDETTASAARALFNYQLTAAGLSAEVDQRALEPERFFRTCVADDWSAVAVAGNRTTPGVP